ncbi:MAG: lytic murein transglycosylase [Nocardioidaceae bacterium]
MSAVVPITLVAGAWGVAVTASPGSDTIDAKMNDTPPQPSTPAVTDVPTDAFEQPMAGRVKKNQSDRHPLAEVEKAQTQPAALKSSPLPTPALNAYRNAAKVMADVKGGCKLDWTLVAAIGRVESDHGQYAGSTVDTSGVSSPKIIGIPLDGTNETAAIRDTDDGAYDGDTTWDRAVGPMQFIPSTWDLVGVDGNGDGEKDPNNIYDAALAASVYLCADGEDVSTRDGASEAVFSYNHSTDYVANVLAIAEAYRHGDFSEAPGVVPETGIVPEGTMFDPGAVDDADGESEHRLKPTEFGPAHAESGGSDTLRPMHKDTVQQHGQSDDKGDHKPHQVEPAAPAVPGKGEGLIQEQIINPVPRGDASPAEPKGNSKPDNTDGFADHRPADVNQGTGRGEIQEQHIGPSGGPRDDVGPREDKARPPVRDHVDHKAEDTTEDEPRHKAEDRQQSDVPAGPGVDVRPKHRAEVEPAGPREDAKPTEPRQDATQTEPEQDTTPARPEQDTAPVRPERDTTTVRPKRRNTTDRLPDATTTSPASATYLPIDEQADSLVGQFLASYSLFWSLPAEGSNL